MTNADAFALMVETMLGADHSKSISRHERTLVVVHANADLTEAHLHDGPSLAPETARAGPANETAAVVSRAA